MAWPSVSVIIPSYNQGQYLERTLLSILKQDYPGAVQVIVSDGGSTDSTVEVLRKYPQVVWWSKRDRGFADAVNQGLAVATGEVVAIQSSDDYYLPGAFRKAVSALMQDPELVFVTGNDVFIGENGVPGGHVQRPSVTMLSPGALLDGNPSLYVSQHCTFIRRSAINRVGGLRENVDYCADFDLWYRALHFGRALMLPDVLAVYQLHSSQRTQNKADLFIRVHKQVVEDAEANPEYASRFVPTPDMKRNRFRHWEVAWSFLAGGEEGARAGRALALETLQNPEQWSPHVLSSVRYFVTPPAPAPASRVRRAARALRQSLRQNSVFLALRGRPPYPRYVVGHRKETLDLGWWKGKDVSSYVKAVPWIAAAACAFAAVRLFQKSAAKKPSPAAMPPDDSFPSGLPAGNTLAGGGNNLPDGMVDWPSVSVIIPSYNQGQYLERTLLSILKQDYPGAVQVIVSDGGSTDSTVSVLKRYPQVVWWSKRDRGFADAVNQGLAVATGEVVAIQSSDDYYLPGAFRKAVSALMQDPELVFATGSDLIILENGYSFPLPKPHVSLRNPGALISRAPSLYIPQHCTFVRRRAIDLVDGLREEVDRCADFDLWYRLLHFGKGVMLSDFLAVYQKHTAQRTQNKASLWIDAHLKVIEDAEANPKYARRYTPDPKAKREITFAWEVLWNSVAGGQEGAQKAYRLVEDAVRQPQRWSDYVIEFIKPFGPKPPSPLRRLASGIVKGVKSHPAVRTVAGRLGVPLAVSHVPADLTWWAEGRPAASPLPASAKAS